MTAEMMMLIGGISAFALTLYWVRTRHLLEKYAIGWMVVASILLICGLCPDLIKRFAEACRLSYPAAVLLLALGGIYIYAFAVSFSLSRHTRHSVRLTQEVSLLELRLRQLEDQMPHTETKNSEQGPPQQTRGA